MDATSTPVSEARYEQPEDREDLASALQSVKAIFRRRWLVMLTIIVVGLAAGISVVLLMTPKYEAISRIKIDPSPGAAVGQLTDQSSFPDQAIVDTEVAAMKSIDIARDVVQQLNLTTDPEFTRGVDPVGPHPTAAELDRHLNAVAGQLLARLSVSREKVTYIVDLGITSASPVKAARIANTFANQYIETTLSRRTGKADRQTAFLEQRLGQLRDQAAQADSQLAEYRARAGIIQTGNGVSSAIDQQVAPLAGSLATAQSEAAAASAKVRAAEQQISSGGIDRVSAVITSDVIRNLRAQRATLVEQQGEILTRYGPRHPEMLRVNEQLAAVDKQINDEAQRIVAGLRADAISAQARASSLAADLAKLRSQQSASTRASAEADTYQRQADAAQLAYNRLAEKVQTSMQAAGSQLSQAQIVEQAVPPVKPSKPNKPLLLAIALLGATVLAIGTAGVLEITNTGLLAAADLRRLGVRFIGSIPKLDARDLKVDGDRLRNPADLVPARPVGFYAESIRNIRSTLILGESRSARIIAIASALPEEGKTNTSLALARVMALAGDRVIVVDCDVRRAALSAATTRGEIGLVEVLKGEATLETAIVHDLLEPLSILPVATSISTPEDLFNDNAMPNLLAQLRHTYDYVIVDMPPMLGIADARMLAVLADAVILVARWNQTPRSAIQHVISMLQQDGANLIGGVLSMTEKTSEAYGAMYYSKKYGAYYSDAVAR